MKNIKHITKAFLILVLLSAAACSENFIEVPPLGMLSDATFDPKSAVTASYNSLGPQSTQWSNWRFVVTGDILSDDAWKGGSSQTDQIDFYTLNIFSALPSNGIVKDHWELFYQRIFRFNWALTNLSSIESQNPVNSRYIGEVKFLRALHYFWLVRTFGDVPLVEKPLAINERNLTRTPESEVYAFIEQELIDASARLPLKGAYPAADLGRVTKGAAQSLLAKVYLYQKKFQQAFDASAEVISSGQYTLENDFATIFTRAKEHGTESVFEITVAPNDQRSNPGYHAIAQRSRNTFGGWGLNAPTKDLLDAFEDGDPRIIHTITFSGDVTEGTTHNNTGYDNPDLMHSRKAFKPRSLQAVSSTLDGENIRVIRYAEVVLIYAEAANEIGQTQEALNKLNLVRQRARNSSKTDIHRTFINYTLGTPDVVLPDVTETDKNALRNIIWEERRVELALEGDRFFDLVRQGRAGEVLRAFAAKYNTDKGKNFTDGIHERFPVPQDEIDRTAGVIAQNPGY